jgi:hypothetical protein
MPTLPDIDSLFHRNERLERLISGQETRSVKLRQRIVVVPVRDVRFSIRGTPAFYIVNVNIDIPTLYCTCNLVIPFKLQGPIPID